MTLRIAAAAYPLSPTPTMAALAAKRTDWAEAAARTGASLLVFPEYAGMELASLAGPLAGDLDRSIDAAADRSAELDDHHASLARRLGVVIVAGSGPVRIAGGRAVNRARIFGPGGGVGTQDKMILTPWERDIWGLAPGTEISVFETEFARVGILICYDAEFPLLGRALANAGAEILAVPAATETLAGQTRVRTGAMARALEGTAIVAHAPLVGRAPWVPAVDVNRGRAAVYAPPDRGFPSTGVLAEGGLDRPGWVTAEVDLTRLADLRSGGEVHPLAHWPEQETPTAKLRTQTLP